MHRQIEELRLLPSGGGRFEITMDGKRIWSKEQTKSFPTYEQVLTSLTGSGPG
ncbi:MAG TPA: Rdx family protein [Actinomycetota bacterium]|nr:Rdx family protein [Actinomycetota bacterium]